MTKRAYILPLLILIFLFSMLFIENIRLETKLPSEGWSRSFDLHEKSSYLAKPFIDDNKVFFAEDKEITEISCEKNMECIKKKVAAISVPGNAEFWVKGDKIVYQDNETLYLWKNGSASKIKDGVSKVRTNKNFVLFWKEQELYQYNTETEKITSVLKSKYPIVDIAFDDDTFVAAGEMGSGKFQFTYFKAEGESFNTTYLPLVSLVNDESLEGFKYSHEGKKLHFIMNTLRISQGSKEYDSSEFVIDASQLKQKPDIQEIQFVDEQTGMNYKNAKNLNLREDQTGAYILFTAYGPRFTKYEGYNLYLAQKAEHTWSTKRISTTMDLPIHSFWLENDEIIWSVFSGKDNKLYGTTKDKEAISRSKQITKTDMKYAASNTVSGLFGSFIILLFTMMWILLPCIYFGILFFSKGNLFEDDTKRWVVYIPMILYLISQLYTFNTSFRKENYIFAPDYLTFQGSFIAWPIILALLSWAILTISKLKDINPAGKFFYFAVIDTLFTMLLIGPYIL